MNAEFLKAVAPEPFRVLGQRLVPFSIGHAILLTRFGVDGLRDASDLAIAVLLCSEPATESAALLRSRWLPLRLFLWRVWLGRFDFDEKRALFLDYIEANSHRPSVFSSGESGFMPGAPFMWHVKVTLQAKLNYTPAEAFNAPLGLALWDYFTFWENEGEAEILGDSPAEMFALANRMHDDLLKAAREGLN